MSALIEFGAECVQHTVLGSRKSFSDLTGDDLKETNRFKLIKFFKMPFE